MAEALGHAGRFAEGLTTVGRGLVRSQSGWLAPELLRIKSELFLLQGNGGSTDEVGDVFRQAPDAAREHGSLSWELRAAKSLARLPRDQGRPADAAACLRPIYDRFTEGFLTADLVSAKQLLDDLAAAGYC